MKHTAKLLLLLGALALGSGCVFHGHGHHHVRVHGASVHVHDAHCGHVGFGFHHGGHHHHAYRSTVRVGGVYAHR